MPSTFRLVFHSGLLAALFAASLPAQQVCAQTRNGSVASSSSSQQPLKPFIFCYTNASRECWRPAQPISCVSARCGYPVPLDSLFPGSAYSVGEDLTYHF